jgi:hypothetical protein
VLAGLEKSHDQNWRDPLPPVKKENKVVSTVMTFAWMITFVLPWIWRRVRGKSSGDGRSGKYESPIRWLNSH